MGALSEPVKNEIEVISNDPSYFQLLSHLGTKYIAAWV